VKTLDPRRRRLVALAGALAAIAGGLSGFIGRRGDVGVAGYRYFLIGLSVGVTVGIVILAIAKIRRADCD
jgi:hypothetical protein